ncbi:MAG: hypothetical protein ABSE20_02225 [Acetobacteraceae bacterium]
MPTIESAHGVVTQINVFTVAPEKQQLLADPLIETVEAAKTVPGWLSASVHRSFDGAHVVHYGHPKSNLEPGTVAPGQYEVV